jgi:signal transduction histidine kinase
VEVLLIPFAVEGRPIGTVWIVSHTEGRTFDREDERIMQVLAQFAAVAWQLWKAIEISDKANQRKDEFLAVLGHELRNPLSAIVGAVQILRTEHGGNDNLTKAVEILSRQTQHLTSLIGDLLDVTRIGAGKLRLQKKDIELRPVVDQAVEIIRDQVELHGHQLTVLLPAESIRLDADPGRLTQMIANLLENAVKYTPNGGCISVGAELSGRDVCIRVRDNGIGLPKEKLTAIFDLFTQLDSRERSNGGLGLGLRLVQTLTEMHGGTVEARSEGLGKGSEFQVRLPFCRPQSDLLHRDSSSINGKCSR